MAKLYAAPKKAAKKGIAFAALLPQLYSLISDHLPTWCTDCVHTLNRVCQDLLSFFKNA